MIKKWLLTLIGLSLAVLIMGACAAAASTPAAAGNVTFIIPIQSSDFSPKATLHVSLWGTAQMAAADNNAPCAISQDTQGTQTITCPDGVTYSEVKPEELSIPIGEAGTSLTIASTSIRVGEPYRVSISGLSSDSCNAASASAEGTAGSETITLESLHWMRTEMACPGS
jgi:hypothetical protein